MTTIAPKPTMPAPPTFGGLYWHYTDRDGVTHHGTVADMDALHRADCAERAGRINAARLRRIEREHADWRAILAELRRFADGLTCLDADHPHQIVGLWLDAILDGGFAPEDVTALAMPREVEG